jgi:CheY-like chemotaxis protein
MKILFLHPQLGSGHAVLQGLRQRGVAVLLPQSTVEAMQMLALHGSSVDLAVVHREIADDGLAFVFKMKSDPAQADLPYVLSTEAWSDGECAKHQQTATGANAYLRFPYTERQLVQVIEAVTGAKLPSVGAIGETTQSGLTVAEAPSVVIENHGQPIALSGRGDAPIDEATHFMSEAEQRQAGIVVEPPTATEDNFALPVGVAEPPTAVATQILSPSAPPTPAPAGPADISLSVEPGMMEVIGVGGEAIAAPQLEVTSEIVSPSLGEGIAAEVTLEAPQDFPPVGRPEVEPMTLDLGAADAPRLGSDLSFAAAEHPSEALDLGGIESTGRIERVAATSPVPESSPPDTGYSPEPSLTPMRATRSIGGVVPADDGRLAQELPYLFEKAHPSPGADEAALALSQPLGDAVVPGGAANSPDFDTLKKYLLLREQDVAALSAQLKAAREHGRTLEDALRAEKGRSLELAHVVEEQRRRLADFDREKAAALESVEAEAGELRFQLKSRAERGRMLERQVREAAEETERLKDRVRADIRKIRVREKELENRLELMKRDAESLIAARENRIVELKRKLDTIEFNLDLLQDKYNRERETSGQLRERLRRAAQAVRAAGGMLDPGIATEEAGNDGKVEPGTGGGDRVAS